MWVKEGVSENTSSVLRERKIYIECVYSKRERESISRVVIERGRERERERERERTQKMVLQKAPRGIFLPKTSLKSIA